MTVKTHTFRGKQYRILLDVPRETLGDDRVGDTDAPRFAKRELRILKGAKDLMLLDTLIHESLHACAWDLDEEAVGETATDIARLLWRLGYRRKGEFA